MQAPSADARTVLDSTPPAAPGAVFAVLDSERRLLADLPAGKARTLRLVRAIVARDNGQPLAASRLHIHETDIFAAVGRAGDKTVSG